MFCDLALIIAEPKSTPLIDLQLALPIPSLMEIIATGFSCSSLILEATIPIIPGCQFDELAKITGFLSIFFALICFFASIRALFSIYRLYFIDTLTQHSKPKQ